MAKIVKLAPHEETLVAALKECVDLSPSRIAPLLAQTLEAEGMRVVLAILGESEYPQIEITATGEDATEGLITQLVTKALTRFGVPGSMIPIMASLAGTAVAKVARHPTPKRSCKSGACR